ncbi:MAG: hypothetical protein ACLR5G_04160 [Eubacteriales bacterium]
MPEDIAGVYDILKKAARRLVRSRQTPDVKKSMKIDYFSDEELIKAQSEKYSRQ